MTDDRWLNAAIVAANHTAIFATMFASTRAQRERLREAFEFVFGALAEGSR